MLICYGFCGSFCTVQRSLRQLRALSERGETLLPVASFAFSRCSTRFGTAEELRAQIESVCRHPLIDTLTDAEPIGPQLKPDAMVIAPTTGNTLAKLCHGIYDTPVTLAAKSVLRSGRPLVLALATNDALSGGFENLASMFRRKHIFFLPMRQDDPKNKPYSLVADFERLPEALDAALEGRQLFPLFEC